MYAPSQPISPAILSHTIQRTDIEQIVKNMSAAFKRHKKVDPGKGAYLHIGLQPRPGLGLIAVHALWWIAPHNTKYKVAQPRLGLGLVEGYALWLIAPHITACRVATPSGLELIVVNAL